MSTENLDQAHKLLDSLRTTFPEDFMYEVTFDDGDVAINLSGGGSWIISTYPAYLMPCELTQKILDELHHFIQETYTQWWPSLGAKKLGYTVVYENNQPEVHFTLTPREHPVVMY